jgi:hypothetical protein
MSMQGRALSGEMAVKIANVEAFPLSVPLVATAWGLPAPWA